MTDGPARPGAAEPVADDDGPPDARTDDPRRRARQVAVMTLYRLDVGREDPESSVRDLAGGALEGLEEEDGEGAAFGRLERRAILDDACERVRAVIEERDAIDEELEKVSEHWRLARMAAVERNILRLAAWELHHRPDVPAAAIINEAVELGKVFAASGSGAFINGLLERVRVRSGRTAHGTGDDAFQED